MKSKFLQVLLASAFSCAFFAVSHAAQSIQICSTYTQNCDTVYYGNGSTSPQGGVQNPVTQPVTGTPTNVCPVMFTNYNKFGDKNESVSKLQMFLNDKFGAKLNGQGYFGPLTKKYVSELQMTYGLPVTGNQYEKTTQLLNDINCGKIPVKTLVKIAMTPKVSSPVKTSYVPYTGAMNTPQPTENNNIVKDYAPIPKLEGSVPTTSSISSTNTLAEEKIEKSALKSQWDKIKENYKAYLLVFALVLALFWFLRKAATE